MADSLEGPDVAPRDRPLDLQIVPTGNREAFLIFRNCDKEVCAEKTEEDGRRVGLGLRAELCSDSPVVALDVELQVELVHVVEDVVAVRSHQVLVVMDLLLLGCQNKRL